MNLLAPSMLAADFSSLLDQIDLIREAQLLHIDVMDGHFVPNISFGPSVMKSLLGKTEIPFDVHLMIERPDQFIGEFVTDQTEYITVHQEACIHLHRTLQSIKTLGVKAGVALNPATPVSVIENIIEDVDQVLIMSVNPGFGGQKFIPSALKKLREVEKLKNKYNKELTIAVDGGITLDNVRAVLESGANLIVAGSSVFGASDVKLRVRQFLEAINK